MRIYRVLTSDGDLLIGRVIPDNMIDETLRQLGSSRTREKISTDELIQGIKNGDSVYLENGWKLLQRRVSNENRIEIIGADYKYNDILTQKGVFTERIQYQTRFFIPAEKDTIKILDEVLKISPVLRTESKAFSIDTGDSERALSKVQYSIEFQEFADTVLEPMGMDYGFFDGDSSINGYYDKNVRKIWFNINSAKNFITIAGHELYHSLAPEEQRGLAVFFRSQSKTDTSEFKSYKENMMKKYQEVYNGRGMGEFTERDFWEEFAADNCETLFANKDFVNRLSKKSRNLIQKIFDFIRNLLKRLFGKSQYTNTTSTEMAGLTAKTLVQAEKMYADILNAKSWNISPADAMNSISQVTVTEKFVDSTGFGDNNTVTLPQPQSAYMNSNFSIQTDSSGNQYVEIDTDQHLFDGVPIEDYPKVAKKIILEKFRNKVIGSDNNRAFVNKRTAEEYTHPAAFRGKSAEIKSSKMRASPELDNLLAVSQFIEHFNDDGRHEKATGG